MVDTSAVILLINVGSLLKGRIVDLSLSGCRVRADEKLRWAFIRGWRRSFDWEDCPFGWAG